MAALRLITLKKQACKQWRHTLPHPSRKLRWLHLIKQWQRCHRRPFSQAEMAALKLITLMIH
eukprot:11500973-Karenia_brevis.AAC.1